MTTRRPHPQSLPPPPPPHDATTQPPHFTIDRCFFSTSLSPLSPLFFARAAQAIATSTTHTIVPLNPPIDPPISMQGGRAVMPRRRRRPPSSPCQERRQRRKNRERRPLSCRGDGRHRFYASAAAICWSWQCKTTVAMKGKRRRWHRQSMDDQTRTVGSVFVNMTLAFAEIWASASAACVFGGSMLS
jgi:hypothetical protein